MKKISISEMTKIMGKYVKKGVVAYGYIVFSKANWQKEYGIQSRTYKVASTEKYFNQEMNGTSLYGDAIDGSDDEVNLTECYWDIDYCYMDDNNPKLED